MKVVPFGQQSIDDLCIDLKSPPIHPRAYPGQDSTVYHDTREGKAIHVYGSHVDFAGAVLYARAVNSVAGFLGENPFSEGTMFEGSPCSIDVCVNPVEEVGERLFRVGDEVIQSVYTVSPFVEGLSLCWPRQASDEEQRAVARCCNILFYDRITGHIETQSPVACVDINPVNVKYSVDRVRCRIRLTITDLAKDIGIVFFKEG